MRVKKWALVGLVAIALGGCDSPSTDVEPAPGEIDFDAAADRVALSYAGKETQVFYDPWSQQFFDIDAGELPDVTVKDQVDVGLDLICTYYAPDRIDPARLMVMYETVHLAIDGAVISSASDEFRGAYGEFHRFTWGLVSGEDSQVQAVEHAKKTLESDLRDEWQELYELQEELVRKHFDLDSTQQAQLALLERCDMSLSDDAVVQEDPTYTQPFAVFAPPPID